LALVVGLATVCLGPTAEAQINPVPAQAVPIHQDTGWVANTGTQKGVVGAFTVHTPGAAWMRLNFSELNLAGDPGNGSGSALRITSTKDGYYQIFNAISAAQWDNTSAYFNGDTVVVEVIAAPGTGGNRVAVDQATVGLYPVEDTICGNDDRVLSSDPFAARALPIGCTAWLWNDGAGCFGTAGHCMSGASIIQFNVPLSNANGSLNNPPPQDQYSTDNSSRQWVNGGIGNDWAYFGTFPNSNTGLTAQQAQAGNYTLTLPPPFNSSQNIRITGYGVDSSPSSWNQVQQTNAGPWVQSRQSHRYQTDTTGGNSGSPVIHEATGNVIGVHTHGGCSGGGGSNSGTSTINNGWVAARANPLGVCAASCGPPSVTFHNGSGVNPAALASINSPVASTTWQIGLDTSLVAGAASSTIQIRRLASSGVFTPAGEILYKEGPVIVTATLPASGGLDVYNVNIPASAEGVSAVVTGSIRGSGGIQLTNGEMFIVGCAP
jgi:hypothetical protein